MISLLVRIPGLGATPGAGDGAARLNNINQPLLGTKNQQHQLTPHHRSIKPPISTRINPYSHQNVHGRPRRNPHRADFGYNFLPLTRWYRPRIVYFHSSPPYGITYSIDASAMEENVGVFLCSQASSSIRLARSLLSMSFEKCSHEIIILISRYISYLAMLTSIIGT
jgi:hypothetical protein